MAECPSLFGLIPQLSYKIDSRIWTSSVGYAYYDGLKTAASIGYNGGIDMMWTTGELNQTALTWGSQRPAL